MEAEKILWQDININMKLPKVIIVVIPLNLTRISHETRKELTIPIRPKSFIKISLENFELKGMCILELIRREENTIISKIKGTIISEIKEAM